MVIHALGAVLVPRLSVIGAHDALHCDGVLLDQDTETFLAAVLGACHGGRFIDWRTTQSQAYEARHYPIDPADPVEAIEFRMDRRGLTPRDLEPVIGRLNRVYEVLARRRPLTMPMVWRLHTQLGIPAASLIRPPKPV